MDGRNQSLNLLDSNSDEIFILGDFNVDVNSKSRWQNKI